MGDSPVSGYFCCHEIDFRNVDSFGRNVAQLGTEGGAWGSSVFAFESNASYSILQLSVVEIRVLTSGCIAKGLELHKGEGAQLEIMSFQLSRLRLFK